MNALKHGFTSRNTIVLECENEAEFQELLAEYAGTYQPAGPVEKDLVDEMIGARWRMRRLRIIETALLDCEMDREPPFPEPDHADPGYRLASAFRRLVDDSHALSFLSRNESRLHRIHERSHRTLRELQQSRKQRTSESNSAAPVQPEAPPPAAAEPAQGPNLGSEPAPPSPEPQLLLRGKKVKNEPKPARRTSGWSDVQRLVLVGHRGIRSYIGSKKSQWFQQLKTA